MAAPFRAYLRVPRPPPHARPVCRGTARCGTT